MTKKKYRNPASGENTVIGKGTIIDGSIQGDSVIMRVDGKVNGGINTKGELVVGPDGEVCGDIKASCLVLAGSITGNADVEYRVEITSTGKLIGDVNTELLAMDEHGVLQGKVNMSVKETDNNEKIAEEEKEDSAEEKNGVDE